MIINAMVQLMEDHVTQYSLSYIYAACLVLRLGYA